ncbi:hypothetical protein VPHD479_0060 [Vibrio phage D479]
MNITIATKSFTAAFGIHKSQVGFNLDGAYGRVFGIETDAPIVKVNYKTPSGKNGMKKAGKKLSAQIIEFVSANIELAK